MPRVQRILETAVYCDDLQLTAAFYERLLELTPILATERLVAFDAGNASILLLFQRGFSTQPIPTAGGLVPAHDGSGPTHFAFAIEMAEFSAWEARLGALHIPIESRVTWARGGRSLYFRDPEGRSVELATPGTWPSY